MLRCTNRPTRRSDEENGKGEESNEQTFCFKETKQRDMGDEKEQ